MATEFLNDARREIEGRTEDFYGELKAFYQGNAEAEQNLMEQTTQPFWQSLRLSRKRLQQRNLTVDMDMQEPATLADYEGPKKDGCDYTCRRTKAVKMRRTYYREGKKIAFLKTPEIMEANFLKADVQGDMAVCPNCGHEGRLSSYIDGCDACGAKFLVSDFETKVSGFSLEEDAKQKSIFNFIKAGVTVGIVAVALALLAICAGGIMFLLLALGRNGYNAVKAATALGIYGIILAFSLVFMIHSEDGKETLAIWQSLGRSSEYLEAIQQDIVYPDDVLEGLTETDSEEGRFASTKVYACENSEVVKEAYKAALLKRGFLEMQQYPEGFSVFKIEDPSVYMTDEEEEMFYLVIRVENASEGITVTATLVDENWEPVQE